MSTLTPTIILKLGWDNGLAFSGKHAGDFLKLISEAKPVAYKNNGSGYHWFVCSAEDSTNPNIELFTKTIEEMEEEHTLRHRLSTLESKVEKHKDMIEAAEALNPTPQ